jgi:hypothetical protein
MCPCNRMGWRNDKELASYTWSASFESRPEHLISWLRFSWLSIVPSDKFRDTASNAPGQLPSKSLPNHHPSFIHAFYATWSSFWTRLGRAVAQAFSRWLPTAATRIRVRAACGVCGGQSGTVFPSSGERKEDTTQMDPLDRANLDHWTSDHPVI